MQPALLYVASDASGTVVSRHRLRTAGGQVTRRRWGAVVESTSTTPAAEAAPGLAGAAFVVLPPVAVAVPLALTGAPAALSAGAGAVAFLAGAWLVPALRRRRAGAAAPGVAAIPAVLLAEARDRRAFAGALARADEISASWSAMAGLIEVAEAENLLADALWHLAGILARRQDARRAHASLTAALPAMLDAAAGAAGTEPQLAARQKRAAQALALLDAQVARRLDSLATAAEAGRRYARDREAHRPAPGVLDGTGGTGDGTSAVLAAYRNLAAGHGDAADVSRA